MMEYLLYNDTDNESSRENSPENSIFESSNKPNDNDLIKIYNYYVYKGYYNIVSIQFVNLITTIFLYLLFIFLVMCIDYQGLIEIKSNEENIGNYVNFGNLLNTNAFYMMCMIFMVRLFRNLILQTIRQIQTGKLRTNLRLTLIS